jgi:hypothetical protein
MPAKLDLTKCMFVGGGDVMCPDGNGSFVNKRAQLCNDNAGNIGCSVIPNPRHPECIAKGILVGGGFASPVLPFLPAKLQPVGTALTVVGAVYGGVKLGWQQQQCDLNPFPCEGVATLSRTRWFTIA